MAAHVGAVLRLRLRSSIGDISGARRRDLGFNSGPQSAINEFTQKNLMHNMASFGTVTRIL